MDDVGTGTGLRTGQGAGCWVLGGDVVWKGVLMGPRGEVGSGHVVLHSFKRPSCLPSNPMPLAPPPISPPSTSDHHLSHLSQYIVHLGMHHLQRHDGWEQTRRATESFPHPDFNNSVPNKDHRNDIMLVKLASPAIITWAVRPLTLSQYIVHLGMHHLQRHDGWEQTRRATESFPHPDFNNSVPNKDHRNDIMLVKLASPAIITWAVRPLTLSSRCVTPGTRCLISGWGTTSSPQLRLPQTLRCANITIIDHKECENAYPGNITTTMVCASVREEGKDSCQGDSGGPLVCNGSLQGIISWGQDPCAVSRKPGVYTKVCKQLWARVGDDHLLLLQGEQLRRTTRFIMHPKYHHGSGPILPRRTDDHDLMLLKLARPAVLGSRIQTLRLPYRCAQPGDQCQVAGWGTTAHRRGKVSILRPRECEAFYPGVLTNNMLCAGLDQGQDPCQSDSGGPLVCDETLQGVLSWGVYPCGSAQHPAVYTQICKYTSWIEKTIRSN
ncbi:Kallikrein-10 [Myotis davidii]|uniref:Kallikrein-10 n=1 Tax=Myotis davidii TaxID=225400 RepID=L5MHN0_MYODS|nr:Kallikrein-10 [Myotis davidii]